MVEKQSGLPVCIESVNSSNLRSVMDASRSEAKLAGVMGHPCRNLRSRPDETKVQGSRLPSLWSSLFQAGTIHYNCVLTKIKSRLLDQCRDAR